MPNNITFFVSNFVDPREKGPGLERPTRRWDGGSLGRRPHLTRGRKMLPEISIPRLYFMIMEKSDSTRMSKRACNHSYGWGPRLRLGRPTSVLVIKCTTLQYFVLK
jgi:hypothetical protein